MAKKKAVMWVGSMADNSVVRTAALRAGDSVALTVESSASNSVEWKAATMAAKKDEYSVADSDQHWVVSSAV